MDLYRILVALRNRDIEPALEYVPPFPEQSKAIEYANKHLQPFFATHSAELKRLMCCLIFLPKERMQKSPYEDLTSEAIHLDLENIFATEFSASLGMSKQPPLRVVGDIGGGGALAKIEKGRKIMRERKSEWSQADELPVSNLSLKVLHYSPWPRSKYPCLLKTDTILFLHAQYRKTSRQNRTRR